MVMRFDRGGKAILAVALMDKLGYSGKKAERVLNAIITYWKKALKQGQGIPIEGVGILKVTKSRKPTHRVIYNALKNNPATIRTIYKRPKTVRLLKTKEIL
jgi:nucleoid DNA-binding protein